MTRATALLTIRIIEGADVRGYYLARLAGLVCACGLFLALAAGWSGAWAFDLGGFKARAETTWQNSIPSASQTATPFLPASTR